MPSILEQLAGQLSGPALSSLSRSLGADETSTKAGVAAALPVLLAALARNAERPEGARALNNALARDHDGSILDNLHAALERPDLADGESILKHVLGGRQPAVQAGVGRAAGLDTRQAGQLFAALAPLVMGYLGQARRSQSLQPDDLAEVLKGERSGIDSRLGEGASLLTGLLDRDGDGSILDDVGGSILKRFLSR